MYKYLISLHKYSHTYFSIKKTMKYINQNNNNYNSNNIDDNHNIHKNNKN